MKEYFLPLLHFVHNSGRRAMLFSRTSSYRIKMTFLPLDMHCPRFQKWKSIFLKQRAFFNMIVFLLFLASYYILISGLFFFAVCIHDIITNLEALVEIMDRQGSTVSLNRKIHQEVKQLSIKLQGKNWDCLLGGFVFELSNVVYPKIPEIKLKELKTIWKHWTVERQNAFMAKYGDITFLFSIKVDEQHFKAIILLWDPSYWCFIFNQEDFTLTVKEYSALLKISPADPNKVFWKKAKKVQFRKKLA